MSENSSAVCVHVIVCGGEAYVSECRVCVNERFR